MKQVIISNLGKVWELVVVDIHGKALLNLLLNIVVHIAYDLPEPGVPSTIEARNGLTTLIQPLFHFFL